MRIGVGVVGVGAADVDGVGSVGVPGGHAR
jgi:hypothetical protein